MLWLEMRGQAIDIRSIRCLDVGSEAPVAQRIEHQTSNLGVGGSSPSGRTKVLWVLWLKRLAEISVR